MNRWIRRLLGSTLILMLGAAQAFAVALGNIEVTSHLGEPFHAEVPLNLEKNERISSVFVELASPSEYRILEVYRDPALNVIRTDIKNDARGARVELTSDSAIEAPYFNLILKVRHGHATHFKKFPIFLDLPEARPVQPRALPTVSAVKPAGEAGAAAGGVAAPAVAATSAEKTAAPGFKPFDGWARIGRYGPMVYGDTISTVAKRLRIDDRYTMAQVMMALFYKNRSKFDHDNVNLIKAGTYLDVPRAREVEAISPARARKLLAEHNRVWAELKKQPRYAAVAEAQKNRYKARVRVGRAASGVAEAPLPAGKETGKQTRQQGGAPSSGTAPQTAPAGAGAKPAQGGNAGEAGAAAGGATAAESAQLKQLQQQNAELQQKLKDAEAKVEAMSAKLASSDVAAANARIKKLELRLARLQAELDRQKQARAAGGAPGWMTYGLGGLVVVLLALVGYLLSRMRRMSAPAVAVPEAASVPEHAGAAAETTALEETPEFEEAVQEFEEVSADEAAGATQQMSAEEYKDAFTDSVPDLTESDTAEMEPFQESVEEEPDPNVDYLAEADVYLRYGMEDEAIHQLRLAIKQRPDNAEAHARLVQTLKAKGDEAGANEAAAAARELLSGEALSSFEDALASEESGGAESGEEIDLGDTLPPTGIEALDFTETGESAGEEATAPAEEEETLVLGEEAGGEEASLGGLDIELPSEAGEASEAETETVIEEPTLAEEPPLSEEVTIGHEEPEAAAEETEASEAGAGESEAEQAPGPDAEGVLDMTEIEMGDLDWDSATTLEEDAGQETVIETPEDKAEGEAESGAAVEPEAAASETHEATGADLDLSDIEMPDIETDEKDESAPSVEIETSDLEKTVAIDWSGDTEALDELTGGFGTESAKDAAAETGPADAGDEKASGETEAAEPEASKSGEQAMTSSGVLDIGLDEIDMEAAGGSGADVEMDDFTSTVQLTVETKADEDSSEDIGLESVELEAPADLEINLDESEVKDEPAEGAGSDAGEESASPDLEPGVEESDITHELDTLLTELDMGESEPTPDSLDVDKARSLLAEGQLDEAESLFRAAADGGRRGQGLLGLAEVAIRRGDADKAREILGEAESLVDDASRDWFESLKQQADAL